LFILKNFSCIKSSKLGVLFFYFFDGWSWKNWMSSFIRCKHFVEVGNIKKIFWKFWLKLWSNFFCLESINIDIIKPWMSKNFFNIILGTKSILRFFGQTFAYEIFTLFRHSNTMLLGIWEEDWFGLYQIIHLLIICASSIKWWETNDHFICQYT